MIAMVRPLCGYVSMAGTRKVKEQVLMFPWQGHDDELLTGLYM